GFLGWHGGLSRHPSALEVYTKRGRGVRNDPSPALLHQLGLLCDVVIGVGQVSEVVDCPLVAGAVAVDIPDGARREASHTSGRTSRNWGDRRCHSTARSRNLILGCRHGNGVGPTRPPIVDRVPD